MSSDLSEAKRSKTSSKRKERTHDNSIESTQRDTKAVWVVISHHPLRGESLVGVFLDNKDAVAAMMNAAKVPLKDGRSLHVPVSILCGVLTPSSADSRDTETEKK